MGLKRTVDPTVEPISVAELKAHAKIETTAEDAGELPILIGAATRDAENYLKAAFITQTWQWGLDGFWMPPWNEADYWPRAWAGQIGCGWSEVYGDRLILPRPPLQSIGSIAYTDPAGAAQTLTSAGYQLDTISMPSRLAPAYGTYWPATRPQLNAAILTLICGYGDAAANVPQNIRLAILIAAGFYFYNRDQVGNLPEASRRLLDLEWAGNVR